MSTVEEAMRKVITLPPESSVEAQLRQVKHDRVGKIPVYQDSLVTSLPHKGV